MEQSRGFWSEEGAEFRSVRGGGGDREERRRKKSVTSGQTELVVGGECYREHRSVLFAALGSFAISSVRTERRGMKK